LQGVVVVAQALRTHMICSRTASSWQIKARRTLTLSCFPPTTRCTPISLEPLAPGWVPVGGAFVPVRPRNWAVTFFCLLHTLPRPLEAVGLCARMVPRRRVPVALTTITISLRRSPVRCSVVSGGRGRRRRSPWCVASLISPHTHRTVFPRCIKSLSGGFVRSLVHSAMCCLQCSPVVLKRIAGVRIVCPSHGMLPAHDSLIFSNLIRNRRQARALRTSW
jgi:hypothetical protein